MAFLVGRRVEGRQEDGWGPISGNTSHELQPQGRQTCSFLKSLGFLSGKSLPISETLPALILWSLLWFCLSNNGRKITCSQSVNQVDYIVRIAAFPADSPHIVTSTFTVMLLGKLNGGREVFYHWRSGHPWGVCITKKTNRWERTFITGNNYCVFQKHSFSYLWLSSTFIKGWRFCLSKNKFCSRSVCCLLPIMWRRTLQGVLLWSSRPRVCRRRL